MSAWHVGRAGANVSRLDMGIFQRRQRVGKDSNTDSCIARFCFFLGAMKALTVDIINRVKRQMSLATCSEQRKGPERQRTAAAHLHGGQ